MKRRSIPKKKNAIGSSKPNSRSAPQNEHIPFVENGKQIWISFKHILFIQSVEHYVKGLVILRGKKTWLTKHCLLKQMLSELPGKIFHRIGKFYIINNSYPHEFDQAENTFYFDDFPVQLGHSIQAGKVRM